jgi:hypothetical protein
VKEAQGSNDETLSDAQMAFSTTPNSNGAPIAGKMYEIINKNSGKSLGILSGSTANNAILVQATALYKKFVIDTAGEYLCSK